MEEKYPNLNYVLVSYLSVETDTIEDALNQFARANDKERVRLAAQEAATALRQESQDALTDYVDRYSLFLPDEAGSATLILVRDFLQAGLREQNLEAKETDAD